MTERASISITSSGGGARRIARIVNGEPIWQELTSDEMAAYTAPPTGMYRVKVTGIGDLWQQPKRAEWIKRDPATGEIIGPTEDTMTRVEFEVMEGKGKGRRFSSRVNCVIGPKSNLGQVWMATVGAIPKKIEITDLLDKELSIYVERNEGVDQSGNKVFYANPTWSTAKAVGASTESDDEWPAA